MTDRELLKRIYNACDPYRPASESQYLDCSEARGGNALAHEFQRRLQLADDYLTLLFTGHIGCGKSSELKQLERLLEDPTQQEDRYFPIRIDVQDFGDDYDFDLPELLLSIVSYLAEQLRSKLDIELRDNYFADRFKEIRDFLLTDVEITEGELELWNVKAKVNRLRTNPVARHQVRAAMRPRMSSILEELNTLFREARLRLKQHKQPKDGGPPFRDVVFMLDNLEKIRRLPDTEEGYASHRELFLERAAQLTRMEAHFIFTVPLRLVRSQDGPLLEQHYDGAAFVLPMVKVIERDTRKPFPAGLESLRAMLRRRLDGASLDELFATDALDFLLNYCGGHVRSLLIFAQNACAYAESLPMPLQAAHRAIRQSVATYNSAIPEHHWQKLAELHLSPDERIKNGDEDYMAMLENLSVLEYLDDGGDDPFEHSVAWYAVHPIVRELKQFKETVQAKQPPRKGKKRQKRS